MPPYAKTVQPATCTMYATGAFLRVRSARRFQVAQLRKQAFLCHVFVGKLRICPVRKRVNGNASARVKQSAHFDVAWLHKRNKIVHNNVRDIFVEIAVVAKREQVQLQRFAFDHALIGNVIDVQSAEVGLVRNGAQRGELGAAKRNHVVARGVLVLERFEQRRIVVCGVFDLLVAQQGKRFAFAWGGGLRFAL